MMAVDVGVDAIEALEHLAKEGREGFREWNPCVDDMFQLNRYIQRKCQGTERCRETDRKEKKAYRSYWETSVHCQCCFDTTP